MTILHFAFCIFHFALAATSWADAPLAVPVTGEPFRAELSAVDAGWQLTFRIGQRQLAMPAADLVCWGQCPEQGRAGGLVLADGSLLMAEAVAADGQQLTADSELFGTLKLPLEAVSGVVFHVSSNRADHDKLLDRLARANSPLTSGEGLGVKIISPLPTNLRSVPGEGQGVRAVLLLHNGDELSGLLTGIADDTVKLQTDVGLVEVKTDRAKALIFNPALKRKPAAKVSPLQAWVGLSDGSRLLATQLLVENESAKLTVVGQPLAASQRALVFLQPLGGRSVYLSDLKPTEYRQTPYLDLSWPYQADRNVTGGFLRCGGRLYLKGLGVHSTARLVYDLGEGPGVKKISPLPTNLRSVPREGPGVKKISPLPLGEGQGVRAKRFEAEAGIDDSTVGQGSVRFYVLVDGQEKFASPIVRGGQPPVPVSVDISNAKKLELVVDYADRADVLDHADWLNARLTK